MKQNYNICLHPPNSQNYLEYSSFIINLKKYDYEILQEAQRHSKTIYK